ncbi:MAG: hypothetical protein MJ141_04455 [Clostridia bacterium]|nr:hypothetical protein [Clostridia bacterium]
MENRHSEELDQEYTARLNRIFDEKLRGEAIELETAAREETQAAVDPAFTPISERVAGKGKAAAAPQNQAPISLESFDKAYDRHMKQVHEQLEHSRRLAQSVNAASAQAERAAPPPPPRKSYADSNQVLLDESFLVDETSNMARRTVTNASFSDNAERVVVAGSLGVHSSMEETAKDRISREEHLRDSLNDSQSLFPFLNFEKIASVLRGGKPADPKEPASESIPQINPEKLGMSLNRSLRRAVSRFRLISLFALAFLYITIGAEGLLPIPSFLSYKANYLSSGIFSLVLYLGALWVSWDVIRAGFRRLLSFKPDLDSAIALGAIFTLLMGVLFVAVPAWRGTPVPFIIPVTWCFLRLLSRRFALRARYLSVRSVSRYSDAETLLLTVDNGYDGYPTYLRTDVSDFNKFYYGLKTESLGDRITTAYAVVGMVIALLASVITGIFPPEGASGGHLFYAFAVLFSMVPTAAMVISNSLAYSSIAKRMRSSGAYPGGSRSFLAFAREGFTVVSDRDLFPDDTVSITDFKMLAAFDRATVFKYAASLLSAVGCSLSAPFAQSVKDEYIRMSKVTDVRFTGEAISAEVEGHHVIIGDDAAMRRAGFHTTRLPTRTPVYVAIDATLAAVFAINYNPDPDTEYSLRLLIKNLRIPVIAARDFNITVDRVEKSFRVREGVIVCPPIETRVALANPDRSTEASGVVFLKEGLRPIAETVEGARRFRIASAATLITGALAGVIGLLLSIVLLANGWLASLTPLNLFVFQLLWSLPAFTLTLWAKKY